MPYFDDKKSKLEVKIAVVEELLSETFDLRLIAEMGPKDTYETLLQSFQNQLEVRFKAYVEGQRTVIRRRAQEVEDFLQMSMFTTEDFRNLAGGKDLSDDEQEGTRGTSGTDSIGRINGDGLSDTDSDDD